MIEVFLFVFGPIGLGLAPVRRTRVATEPTWLGRSTFARGGAAASPATCTAVRRPPPALAAAAHRRSVTSRISSPAPAASPPTLAALPSLRRPSPSNPFSAAVAPSTAARRPHHRLRQVNHPSTSLPVVDVPLPPASSTSVTPTNRARRGVSDDGGRRGRCQWLPLTKPKLLTPPPRAAVAGIAGELVGRGGGRGLGRTGSSQIPLARAGFVRASPIALNPTQ